MSVFTYKCPNCDAGLEFEPGSQNFACKYCKSSFSQAEIEEHYPESEKELKEETESSIENEEIEGTALYSCPSCGAQVVTDSTTAATFCFYCHNPVVLSGRLQGEFLPDKVLLFNIDRESAIKKFLEWSSKKFFVPKGFFNRDQVEKITGVYFPYFAADYDVNGRFEGEGKQISHFSTDKEEVTTTKHFKVERDAEIHFSNIIRPALRKVDRKLADGVHPYDMSQLRDFSKTYLSGFMAEKRDIGSKALEAGIEDEIKRYVKPLLTDDTTYDQISGNSSASVKKSEYKYILLPTWVLTYKGGNGIVYFYSMNGQTGKICGKLPLSRPKLFACCGAIFAILSALLMLGGYFL